MFSSAIAKDFLYNRSKEVLVLQFFELFYIFEMKREDIKDYVDLRVYVFR